MEENTKFMKDEMYISEHSEILNYGRTIKNDNYGLLGHYIGKFILDNIKFAIIIILIIWFIYNNRIQIEKKEEFTNNYFIKNINKSGKITSTRPHFTNLLKY